MSENSRLERVEEAVRESEERFRATFEQAAVGMALVGLDGRWLRVNRKLCDIVGYAHDELMGLTFQDITHPDDLEADLATSGGCWPARSRRTRWRSGTSARTGRRSGST